MDTDDFQGRVMPQVEGMTLRDWFAGLAMQAALNGSASLPPRTAAPWAYEVADLMLAARAHHDDQG